MTAESYSRKLERLKCLFSELPLFYILLKYSVVPVIVDDKHFSICFKIFKKKEFKKLLIHDIHHSLVYLVSHLVCVIAARGLRESYHPGDLIKSPRVI
jgi:hypothetical protein